MELLLTIIRAVGDSVYLIAAVLTVQVVRRSK